MHRGENYRVDQRSRFTKEAARLSAAIAIFPWIPLDPPNVAKSTSIRLRHFKQLLRYFEVEKRKDSLREAEKQQMHLVRFL